MKLFKIILLVIVALIGYGVYAFGFIGTPKAKDLGIRFTQTDFVSMEQKSGVKHDVLAPGGKEIISYAGSHDVDSTFTSEDFSAFAQYASWKYLPFTNVQIRINEDGTAEASGNMNTAKLADYLMGAGGVSVDEANKIKSYVPISGNPTFYIKVGGSVKENTLQNFSIQSAAIGPVPIPSTFIGLYIGRVEKFLDDRIAKLPGAYVKSMTIEDGKLRYQGSLPDREYAVK
jgi:hypothetical protein